MPHPAIVDRAEVLRVPVPRLPEPAEPAHADRRSASQTEAVTYVHCHGMHRAGRSDAAAH
jgi:hypothetical protein